MRTKKVLPNAEQNSVSRIHPQRIQAQREARVNYEIFCIWGIQVQDFILFAAPCRILLSIEKGAAHKFHPREESSE